ncbi:sensor histidine kinase [Ferdinandcohnia quinoae]|uniref:histidine kinase n=1 Tax=Fredinandcohnia quinoae TaxID=2918902 RepID=A0AAW5E551_9BACI|nr:HAMP domain-containing sensor histidine kinase [Fredinandcohnia sp. SECRCQ15]MCH1625969.1 HAMP domain-containing histidine kinase [Fredinandcohnia sp. SECRCQ15]
MFNKKIFRNQQLKFMLFNLIAFTVIFTIFSIIIFSQVQQTLFSKTDEELLSFKEMLVDNMLNDVNSPPQNKDNGPRPPKDRQRGIPNPRMIVLNWDKDGNIVNEDQIGSLFYENYLQDYHLDPSNIDEITMTTINNLYHFRYILFKDTNKDDDIAYTQLMINVDAEQTIMSNFEKLITICAAIFIILSISASYILSRKMMQPIIHSWNKQAEFVENASHELRTPLTIIQNKLELLLTKPQDRIADKFESIALSLSETRRLSKLTSDLLTLARADSAETQLVKQPIHVDTFIKNVCSPYKEIAESQDKNFWLHLSCNSTIQADEVRFHQLLVILLDNALKYTNDNDSIGVKTYTEDQKIILEVTDTGIGIKDENMKYIFDRFYREDRARSRETGGVGLGLSIAHWIITKHNGTIKVIQNDKRGTTFKIKLPK